MIHRRLPALLAPLCLLAACDSPDIEFSLTGIEAVRSDNKGVYCWVAVTLVNHSENRLREIEVNTPRFQLSAENVPANGERKIRIAIPGNDPLDGTLLELLAHHMPPVPAAECKAAAQAIADDFKAKVGACAIDGHSEGECQRMTGFTIGADFKKSLAGLQG